MALIQTINVNDLPVDEGANFTPLPDGEYLTRIAKCEIKETKDGTGEYFNLQLVVVDGKYVNRVIFGMITRKNKSDEAEKIGHGQLRTIMEAGQINALSDTDQLLGVKVVVRVTQEEYKGVITNKVKSYKSPEVMTVSFAPKAASAEPVQADGKKSPPWTRK